MKILHVITSLNIGGAEKLITEIVPAMIENGNQVDVLAFNGEDTNFKQMLESRGVHVISFCNEKKYYNPIYIWKLIWIIRKYDIVHTHLTSPQLFTAIANLFVGTKLVTTEHNTTNSRRGNALLSRVDRWMYNRYKAVIGISQKTEENLKEFIGESKAKIVTIHNGIDIQEYANASPLPDSEINTNKTSVTMVAAFRPQKDQETLVRAVKRLDASKYILWLVGDGEKHDQLVKYIEDQGMKDRVRLWGNRSDVPSILKSSDIVVMSSHWEGFGLAAAEGMAAGKPVIASNVDGLAQVVEGAGIIFEPGNDEQLANEIERLVQDKAYYDETSIRCSHQASLYDISKMVDSYLAVYNQIMN